MSSIVEMPSDAATDAQNEAKDEHHEQDEQLASSELGRAQQEQGALERLPSNVQVLLSFASGMSGEPEPRHHSGTSRYQLPRCPTAELKDFPDTAEGYVSMVRWYSFQFLLEELCEEMKELHENLCDLLPKLPDCGIKR